MTSRPGFILLLLLCVTGALAEDVTLEFRAKVPAPTPADAKVYLSGDAKPLGEWNGAGVELKRG